MKTTLVASVLGFLLLSPAFAITTAERTHEAAAARQRARQERFNREMEPQYRAQRREGLRDWALVVIQGAYGLDLSDASTTFVRDDYENYGYNALLILQNADHSCRFKPNPRCYGNGKCEPRLNCVPLR